MGKLKTPNIPPTQITMVTIDRQKNIKTILETVYIGTTTLSRATLSRSAFSAMTLSITAQNTELNSAECHFDECRGVSFALEM
jgi:hypothetical protein